MPRGCNGWVGHFAKHLSLRSECSVRRSIEWKIELNVLRQSKATSKTSKCSPCLANYVMLCFSIEWTSMGGHSGPQNVNGALEFGLNTKMFSTFDSWLYQVVLFDLLHSSDLDFSLSFSRKSPWNIVFVKSADETLKHCHSRSFPLITAFCSLGWWQDLSESNWSSLSNIWLWFFSKRLLLKKL